MSHSGLWPLFRPDPAKYPQKWERFSTDATFMVDGIISSPDELGWLFERLGVGTAWRLPVLSRRHYFDRWAKKRRYSIPNLACLEDLKGWSTQHVERPKTQGEQVGDIASAYPSHFRIHPAGTSSRLGDIEPDDSFTWFGLCRVVILHELPLSPLRLWLSGTEGPMGWPRAKGLYFGWLWREQAIEARRLDVRVDLIRGWEWEGSTTDNASWVDELLALRERAKTEGRTREAELVKNVANEAIGYQAIGPWYEKKVKPGRGARPGIEGGRQMDYDVSDALGRGTMLHWQRYTEMLVSLEVFRRALPYAERGELLGIWTDCLEVAA